MLLKSKNPAPIREHLNDESVAGVRTSIGGIPSSLCIYLNVLDIFDSLLVGKAADLPADVPTTERGPDLRKFATDLLSCFEATSAFEIGPCGCRVRL